jgi:hypothetical protein
VAVTYWEPLRSVAIWNDRVAFAHVVPAGLTDVVRSTSEEVWEMFSQFVSLTSVPGWFTAVKASEKVPDWDDVTFSGPDEVASWEDQVNEVVMEVVDPVVITPDRVELPPVGVADVTFGFVQTRMEPPTSQSLAASRPTMVAVYECAPSSWPRAPVTFVSRGRFWSV